MAVALVAQRILEPGSKLAAARSLRPETAIFTLASQFGLPENVSEDQLYEAMDWLLECQPRIEKALAERYLSEGSSILYDLTSVWSYSRTCSLAKYGYSRDGKRGLAPIARDNARVADDRRRPPSASTASVPSRARCLVLQQGLEGSR